jgi:hypothetical protein
VAPIPLPQLVPHYIAVRGVDRVVHHEIVVTDDGRKQTLKPFRGDPNQPSFSYLPDLIRHYSRPVARPGVDFVLQDPTGGLDPSFASFHRSTLDEWNKSFLKLPAPKAVHPGLVQRVVDTMFDRAFLLVFDDVVADLVQAHFDEREMEMRGDFNELDQLFADVFDVREGRRREMNMPAVYHMSHLHPPLCHPSGAA